MTLKLKQKINAQLWHTPGVCNSLQEEIFARYLNLALSNESLTDEKFWNHYNFKKQMMH